jgi:chromosome segregation ATPase
MSIKEELRNTVVTIRTKPYPIKELIPLLNRSSDYIERLEEKISNMEIWEKKYLDRIEELEKQLAFMEGEYPEPTIVEKMKEYESLEQALKRIAELEKENAFLKDWRDTWSPYVNTAKQSEKK